MEKHVKYYGDEIEILVEFILKDFRSYDMKVQKEFKYNTSIHQVIWYESLVTNTSSNSTSVHA